ncbi:hypothetical protein SAM23877_0251 [Streptomyces ambofaciens ATCC 23877]|uniref:Uncharacterized protein SAML0209 n=1 Tax=Streptomyces ambofaciens (strain ATCC 23877 / 3486 / DSM 40053 / JCM 4204 / NBRC 12836 / NRRL B-2516) TaxID=278992 RepID=Q1RRF0_STRA7|nr:hypothetical protein [Streptomyces ambofaciens]AKZ53300.1 hypothetical protein SAM23877_0251 [Streptomyces ambofaciens ATCC 23877]CAI78138.1 unknown hypothetical protein [Streptomyces ambofaciens ATCC 23877]CAJ89196.1 hypothetical protein SAML0209 [Streptomyces ambofaciens ATCC 23877]
MNIDFGAYPYGARYVAYLDHLLRCTECGPTRCTVGADLCTRYLATAGRPSLHGAVAPRPGAQYSEN